MTDTPDLKTARAIFYPLVRFPRDTWGDALNWSAIFVDSGEREQPWIYDCTDTCADAEQRTRYEHLNAVGSAQHIFRFSKIFFNSLKKEPLAIFTHRTTFAANKDLLELQKWQCLACEQEPSDDLCDIWNRVIMYYSNSSKLSPNETKRSIQWYMEHDGDSSVIIYLRARETEVEGGIILSLRIKDWKDYLPTIDKLQTLVNLFFEFYLFVMTFDETEYIPEHAIRKMVWENIEPYLEILLNYDTKLLADFESFIVLYPLFGKLITESAFRWISCFGWHEYKRDLYRIGWKVVPEDDLINWAECDRATDQFRIIASLFEPAIKKGVLPSINELLFMKALKKRPFVLLFDQSKDEVLSSNREQRYLSEHRGYQYASFSDYYSYLIGNGESENYLASVWTALANTNMDEGVEGNKEVAVDNFNSIVEAAVARADRFISKRVQQIRADLSDVVGSDKNLPDITALRNYLIWLACHDFSTRCVVYFPALVREELPTAGVLVAFKELPPAETVMRIETYVNHAFSTKTSLMMELDPTFPVLFHRISFEKRFDMLISKQDLNEQILYIVLDMDNLKDKNHFMHDYGDLYLNAFVLLLKALLANMGNRALIGRWGGDEFMIAIRCKENERQELLQSFANGQRQMKDKGYLINFIDDALKEKAQFSRGVDNTEKKMREYYMNNDSATSFTALWAYWPSEDFPDEDDVVKLHGMINCLRDIKSSHRGEIVPFSKISNESKSKAKS